MSPNRFVEKNDRKFKFNTLFVNFRLGNVVLLSPSLTAPSLPPPPASPQPNYQPQPEAIAASQPQPSAKCLIKKLRQTFCLTTPEDAAPSSKATPDVDFNLPHTTHVDASVRDGVKIELSDGGFVALNSLGMSTTQGQQPLLEVTL